MNYARIVGKILKRDRRPGQYVYIVRTQRSGSKVVHDDMYIVMNRYVKMRFGEIYEFIGKLGVFQRGRSKIFDTCVYVDEVYEVLPDTECFSEVEITGTIIDKISNENVANKILLILNADDDSYSQYKVSAWNRRVSYIKYKQIGDPIHILGELVSFTFKEGTKIKTQTEIVFWEEPQMDERSD